MRKLAGAGHLLNRHARECSRRFGRLRPNLLPPPSVEMGHYRRLAVLTYVLHLANLDSGWLGFYLRDFALEGHERWLLKMLANSRLLDNPLGNNWWLSFSSLFRFNELCLMMLVPASHLIVDNDRLRLNSES